MVTSGLFSSKFTTKKQINKDGSYMHEQLSKYEIEYPLHQFVESIHLTDHQPFFMKKIFKRQNWVQIGFVIITT